MSEHGDIITAISLSFRGLSNSCPSGSPPPLPPPAQVPCYAHYLIKVQQMHLPVFNLHGAEQIGLDKQTFPDRQSHLITAVYQMSASL